MEGRTTTPSLLSLHTLDTFLVLFWGCLLLAVFVTQTAPVLAPALLALPPQYVWGAMQTVLIGASALRLGMTCGPPTPWWWIAWLLIGTVAVIARLQIGGSVARFGFKAFNDAWTIAFFVYCGVILAHWAVGAYWQRIGRKRQHKHTRAKMSDRQRVDAILAGIHEQSKK